MDSLPTLVLIRPESQSVRLLGECEKALGKKIPALIAPIMQIVPLNVSVDTSLYSGYILTSENGVHFAPDLAENSVYCVGKATALAAQTLGAEVRFVAETTLDLENYLNTEKLPGRLVHFHGRHVTKRLETPEIDTGSITIYDQVACTIEPNLQDIICGDIPAVLPLYSARSARLLGRGVDCLGPHLHVIAISEKVARVWKTQTSGDCQVCDAPDGARMISTIVTALNARLGLR